MRLSSCSPLATFDRERGSTDRRHIDDLARVLWVKATIKTQLERRRWKVRRIAYGRGDDSQQCGRRVNRQRSLCRSFRCKNDHSLEIVVVHGSSRGGPASRHLIIKIQIVPLVARHGKG